MELAHLRTIALVSKDTLVTNAKSHIVLEFLRMTAMFAAEVDRAFLLMTADASMAIQEIIASSSCVMESLQTILQLVEGMVPALGLKTVHAMKIGLVYRVWKE